MPGSAELYQRKGQQFARWLDKAGKKRTARVTTGRDGSDRIVVESGRWLAKYRDGSGIIREVTTGCKDKDAARAMLTQMERRAELVRANVMTAAEETVSDHQAVPLVEHLDTYIRSLKAKGRSDRHVTDTTRQARQISADCVFRTLRDIEADSVEQWLADKLDAGMAARTRNSYLQALRGFCAWCVGSKRLAADPLRKVQKADERADRRRQRRSMTEVELQRLLYVARWRPLAEFGRVSVCKLRSDVKGKRDTWQKAPLTFDGIGAAVALARESLCDNPEFIAELEYRGRERELIYKTLVLTGLRKGELASLTRCQLILNGDGAWLELKARDEKNREGAEIPIRADLAAELRTWLQERDTAAWVAVLPVEGNTEATAGDRLFYVPTGLLRILNRDLEAAGIPKVDDRGRTLDVHAVRHTFGTLLSKGGVAPRTAQAALRHSKIDLTMNVYTDPRLLDVAGAINTLPALPLDSNPNQPTDAVRATGTDEATRTAFPPTFPPGTGQTGQFRSSAVTLAHTTDSDSERGHVDVTSIPVTKKASLSLADNEAFKRARRDLNPQPPDRQSGALTN